MPPRGCQNANYLSIRQIYFCVMRGDLLGRMKKHQALNQPGILQFGPPLPLAAGVFGICAVAALLCRLPYRSPRGPLQSNDYQESRGPEGRYSVLGVWPRESKLSTACSPKRNQHRFCDADSLIINTLRRVRDSNPRRLSPQQFSRLPP